MYEGYLRKMSNGQTANEYYAVNTPPPWKLPGNDSVEAALQKNRDFLRVTRDVYLRESSEDFRYHTQQKRTATFFLVLCALCLGITVALGAILALDNGLTWTTLLYPFLIVINASGVWKERGSRKHHDAMATLCYNRTVELQKEKFKDEVW